MFTAMVIVLAGLFIALLLVVAVRPVRSQLSHFELERRHKAGLSEVAADMRREAMLNDIVSLQRVVSALLLVVFVVVSVATFEWLFGTLLALIVALEYGSLARLPVIRRQAAKLYKRYEETMFRFIERIQPLLGVIRQANVTHPATSIHSKAELEHLISTSGNFLSSSEKKLIVNSLGFDEKVVADIMTPGSVIDSIAAKEHLGPLTLDELHKTGHSRFPVTSGGIDHVIGMLHIQDLLTIDARRKSTSVRKAMEPRVFYIKHDQTLQHALSAFLRTKHHLFVVVNEYRETIGLLSLEDVIEALLGRKIVDEFDAHEDLRMVAARNPHHNNLDTSSTDV